MISRVLIKNFLSFKEAEVEFKDGLNVITGPSGAGKSVLINAVLAAAGLAEADAKLIELDFKGELGEKLTALGIENEEINTFKLFKEKQARYFINNQAVSKRHLSELNIISHLSVREVKEFENARLLRVLDRLAEEKMGDEFRNVKTEFERLWREFCVVKEEFEAVLRNEARLEELKEFAKFEFDKIHAIDPRENELDELLLVKKRLSMRDKLEQAWQKASEIFAFENAVLNALHLSEKNSEFFSEAMNELRNIASDVDFSEFDEIDIESLLDRLEALSGLQKRYGSLEEAIAVAKRRAAELKGYEEIEFKKDELQSKFDSLFARLREFANSLSSARRGVCGEFEERLNGFLQKLYLTPVKIEIERGEMGVNGVDLISVNLGKTNVKKISSGELNRLRLAFLATQSEILNHAEFEGSEVLILDEIDSNLSGKEAMSVAQVLLLLSSRYQIIAISHQLQLSVKAPHHFVVEKEGGVSRVREITQQEKVEEISRMISGEDISETTREYAKELLGQIKSQL